MQFSSKYFIKRNVSFLENRLLWTKYSHDFKNNLLLQIFEENNNEDDDSNVKSIGILTYVLLTEAY